MTASNEALSLARPCVRITPRGFHYHVTVHAPGSSVEVTWAVHDREDRARGAADDATRLLATFVDLGLARGRLRPPTSDADPGAFFGACADTLTPAPVEDDGEIA